MSPAGSGACNGQWGLRASTPACGTPPRRHAALPRPATARAPPAPQGAKLGNAAGAVALGVALRYGVPVPDGLDPHSWSLLAFFLTTVAGLVVEPVAAGAWALMCVACALAAHALTFEEAFAAADSQVLWLIVNAFFLAKVRGGGRPRPRPRTLRGRRAGAAAFALRLGRRHEGAARATAGLGGTRGPQGPNGKRGGAKPEPRRGLRRPAWGSALPRRWCSGLGAPRAHWR